MRALIMLRVEVGSDLLSGHLLQRGRAAGIAATAAAFLIAALETASAYLVRVTVDATVPRERERLPRAAASSHLRRISEA